MVSVCTVPARGGRSCEHFGGYKTINRIPLPLLVSLCVTLCWQLPVGFGCIPQLYHFIYLYVLSNLFYKFIYSMYLMYRIFMFT